MNTRGIALEYRLSHWSQVVQDRSRSGQSIKAYCAGAGIQETTYYYWLRKVREVACEGMSAIQGNLQTKSMSSPIFAELKIPARPALSQAAISDQNQICIEAGGVRLIAGSEYPVEKLAELLRMVVAPCC